MLYWVGLAVALKYYYATNLYSSYWTYIWIVLYLAYSVTSIMFQVYATPLVFEWIETAPYMEDMVEEEEEALNEDETVVIEARKVFSHVFDI